MEKQQQNIRSWDDLIFENRNKAYGAYAIRQSYEGGVIKGVLTSIALAIAILVIADFITGGDIIKEVTEKTIVFTAGPPPIIKAEIIPQQQRAEPVRTVNRELPPQVVTIEPVVEPIQEPVTISTGTEGTTTGTEGTDTGTTSGVDTGSELGTVAVKNNQPFTYVEIMPEYKGGKEGMIKTLKKNMRYPASARTMGKEGTVYVEFVVNDLGEIVDVKVIKGFDLACDKEAVRIIEKLNQWTPGIQNKIAVNVKMVLPIKFKLEQ